MTLIDKAEARWPVRGYAPGAYSCECSKCGQAFIGDKRAYQCQDCVIQDLAALPARGVRVKQLQWKQAGGDIKAGDGFSAWPDLIHTPVTIYRKRDGWWLNLDCKTHPTLDAAKAAAQADYEARILAALEPALAPTDAAQAPFRIEDMTLADLMRDPLYEEATTPATDAAQAREAAARLLLDMLHMRNGAHEGVTKDDAQAMWEAASTRVGYAAVDAFLRSIIGEARP